MTFQNSKTSVYLHISLSRTTGTPCHSGICHVWIGSKKLNVLSNKNVS